jgi:hypothetical protein
LATPDFDKPFQIQSDSSGNALGAVLLQDKRPVAYFSQKLKPSEIKYCISDKELLVAYRALVHWRCYVEGRTFSLITDHRPKTGELQALTRMQVKWITLLETNQNKACPLSTRQD